MRLVKILFLSLIILACNGDISPYKSKYSTYQSMLNYRSVSDAIGFYDYTADNKTRDIRNDLDGTLTGMVQFAQTHTIDPKGNAEKFMPSLITERIALLLFTPTTNISDSIEDITVDVMFNNEVLKSFVMNLPEDILQADSTVVLDQEIIYSKRAWSIELDWWLIKHGMELKFTANISDDISRRIGVLAANNIEFSASAEGVFAFIRLGLLTEFPLTGNGAMMTEPAKYMSEYFQTVPFAKIVNITYENRSLDKVMICNGKVYDKYSVNPAKRFSNTIGGWFDGDMRENIGKAQISSGINMANYGLPSWDMKQRHPKMFFSMTTHLAMGKYIKTYINSDDEKVPVDLPTGNNWDHTEYSQDFRHAYSGGGGIGTLMDTTGNEFSHELGHAYGLGHYWKPSEKPKFWIAHHADSGWGYDAYKKRMKGNLKWNTDPSNIEPNNDDKTNFIGKYNYMHDTMSDGAPNSSLSKYTHLTGFSAMMTQNNLSNYAILTSDSKYLKWDKEQQEMVSYTHDPKLWPEDIFGVTNPDAFKPYKVGVPVITILGAYMANTNSLSSDKAVIYPYFRANYGNVFRFPEPNFSSNACWIEVDYLDGDKDRIAIAGKPHENVCVTNQIHINIEEARKPISAKLYCKEVNKVEKLLTKISIPTDLEPMQPAVIIGKEYGYADIIDNDIKWLNEVLPKYANDIIPSLFIAEQETVIRLIDYLGRLDDVGRGVSERFLDGLYKRNIVTKFMDNNKQAIASGDKTIIDELYNLIVQNNLKGEDGNLQPTANTFSVLRIAGKRCVSINNSDESNIVLNTMICEDNKTNQLWTKDAKGKFHSALYPDLCMEATNWALVAKSCKDNQNQKWASLDLGNGIFNIKPMSNQGVCMDYVYGEGGGSTILYNCHGGFNQRVTIFPQAVNIPLFSLMDGEKLKILYDLFPDK